MTGRPSSDPARSAGDAPLPVAVVGCGRMGRLHARVYSQMPRVRLIGVVDADADAARQAADDYGTTALTGTDDLPPEVRAVTVAVPTTHHLSVAGPLLSRGIACLIEKPLADTVDDARKLVGLAADAGVILQVGHIERFNPAVVAMRRLGVSPRFIDVSRVSPLTFRSIDVGVVLDVMIHDIDIVLSLARSPVTRVEAQGVSIIGGGPTGFPVEDICNARLTFENGCVANLTASRLATKTERRLRVFSPEAYVSLDYQKKVGVFVRKTGNLGAIRDVVDRIRRGEVSDMAGIDYTKLLHIEQLPIDDVEPLRAQLDAFVDSVVAGSPPVVSGVDGLAAVETARRIVDVVACAELPGEA